MSVCKDACLINTFNAWLCFLSSAISAFISSSWAWWRRSVLANLQFQVLKLLLILQPIFLQIGLTLKYVIDELEVLILVILTFVRRFFLLSVLHGGLKRVLRRRVLLASLEANIFLWRVGHQPPSLISRKVCSSF